MPEPDAQNQIVVYQPNETVRLDVRLENETVCPNDKLAAKSHGKWRIMI